MKSRRSVAIRLAAANVGMSVVLLGGLATVYLLYDSLLALAQAADSMADAFTGIVLLYSVHVASQPPDDEHPLGHRRAEPIAALLAAMMAGVLAVEVLRSAIEALMAGSQPELAWPLAVVFGAKIAAKLVLAVAARRRRRSRDGPALQAIYMDARNDVLLSGLSLIGFFAAKYGADIGWDSWLAIPVALWIGYSGLDLGRDNIKLLMGEAPSDERLAELEQIARSISGVRSVHGLKAQYLGNALGVMIDIVVDRGCSLKRAHDLGHAVERALLEEPDVIHALARLDIADDEAADEKRVQAAQ